MPGASGEEGLLTVDVGHGGAEGLLESKWSLYGCGAAAADELRERASVGLLTKGVQGVQYSGLSSARERRSRYSGLSSVRARVNVPFRGQEQGRGEGQGLKND